MLKEALDKERGNVAQYHSVTLTLEEEAARRRQLESDLELAKQELQVQKANHMNEISNMKKLIDDHRYQNEELERQYNQKRNEMKDVENELDKIK